MGAYCAVCHTGVGSHSILCNGCKLWVYKKCSGLKHLVEDPSSGATNAMGLCATLMAGHRMKSSKLDMTGWRW